MKHQITFVGGQLLPIYVGIKEFDPDVIHFIVSKESRPKIGYMKQLLIGKSIFEKLCNPFDYFSILSSCQDILGKMTKEDIVLLNLTGGTKIMVLTAQSLIHEKGLSGFYVNQDDTVLMLPSYELRKLTSNILTHEFLGLGGYRLSKSKTLADFNDDDFNSVNAISDFSKKYDKLILQINSKVRKTYDTLYKIPSAGNLVINKATTLKWNINNLTVDLNGSLILDIKSQNVRSLFFHAAWWELIVAKAISNWAIAKELLIQCELPYKADDKITKNEIDVLINLGSKLIFIECKSGLVKQEDINKMRIVKDTYGGIISKSVLVARFKPTPVILEKCKELNVEVFYIYEGNRQVNRLENLVVRLGEIQNKLSV